MTLPRRWLTGGWMAGLALLTGCADPSLEQLESTLSDIRQMPSREATMVIPYVPLYPTQRYQHSDSRSPFLPPESIQDGVPNVLAEGGDAPDQQRPSEPLERFSLSELQLVGTLRMTGRQVAMIATPEGEVVTVGEGNYIGTDYGRIVGISSQEVDIRERIYTQQNGWQARPASLTIDDER
ncbi:MULTISPECIES: pilus assembly protein PilP [unclassified Halomonas]|uniref:pilus assembly protein PilP n=1 Tax=unclassified Halomonas TaxID=2609666 RepID=UPI0006DA0245|nr:MULTISPECIES: pilus assembly protein PilP [unclassified Halomonas]KPQ22144.1 MAG: type IV pilus assembly protein PilP [Halomonas sp. HL-93]SBR51000.1 type IV pilus assembly protein PilP [Halomonas sp. HL-93]SNY97143.1 type IV pilus assembly protein PilP [Halomonas sp. hl-4]